MTTENSPAPIELRDVTKTYGTTASLREVTHTFEPGGIHALVGPNGAGKTTLFHLLLGLMTPDSGHVSMPAVGVGCTFQDPRFYRGLTVSENLELFGTLADGTVGSDRIDHLVEVCGLARVRKRRAGELSAGFAKRLDVALALLDRPGVLLLDEPLADVDDAHRARILDLLAAYRRPDRQLIVATHQFDRFEPLLDTVTVLVDGRIRVTADVATIRERHDGDLRRFYDEVVAR